MNMIQPLKRSSTRLQGQKKRKKSLKELITRITAEEFATTPPPTFRTKTSSKTSY